MCLKMEYQSQRVTHIIFQLFVGNSDQFWRLVKGHFAWTKPSMGMRMGRMVLATGWPALGCSSYLPAENQCMASWEPLWKWTWENHL